MLAVALCNLDATGIGSHDDEVLHVWQLTQVVLEYWCGGEVVDGNVKESLNLSGVKVNCEHSVGTGHDPELRRRSSRADGQ